MSTPSNEGQVLGGFPEDQKKVKCGSCRGRGEYYAHMCGSGLKGCARIAYKCQSCGGDGFVPPDSEHAEKVVEVPDNIYKYPEAEGDDHAE